VQDEWDKAVVSDNTLGYRATLRNFDTSKPVIAAINGFAIAGGMEVLLTGDRFSAQNMLEYGFLNYVVPEDEGLEKALEMAEKIAANGPVAVCAVRRSVREAIGVRNRRCHRRPTCVYGETETRSQLI